MSRVFHESLVELSLYLCHLGVLLPPDIICPPYLFGTLPFRHLPRSMGASFSLGVCAGASCSRGRMICLRRPAGPSRGTAGRNFSLLTRFRWLSLDNLGSSPFFGEPLAVLAALITLTSQVPVMTFFPGLLSVFLASLYTWYCFPALFSLERRTRQYHWKRFIQGFDTHTHGTYITGIYIRS